MIQENPTHGLRRNSHKVCAALPTDFLVDQAKVGFVYKRCALKRMAGAFPAEIGRR
jgi:hypothetical protein